MIRVSRSSLNLVRPDKGAYESMKPWTELKKSWKWTSHWSLGWFFSTSQSRTTSNQIFQWVFLDYNMFYRLWNRAFLTCKLIWFTFIESIPNFLDIWQVAILESSALNSLSNEQSYASVELLTSRHSQSASLKSRSSWWFCFNLKKWINPFKERNDSRFVDFLRKNYTV